MQGHESTSLTKEFFQNSFGGTDLSTAIENAVVAILAPLGDGVGGHQGVVDVDALAKSHGIRVVECPVSRTGKFGQILPRAEGITIVLDEHLPWFTRRFVLAHELGHYLFYSKKRNAVSHSVGLLDKRELSTEEAICNAFARALLLRKATIDDVVREWKGAFFGESLRILEKRAHQYQVLPQTLWLRLASMPIPELTGHLIAFLSVSQNSFSRREERLRVQQCYGFGADSRLHIWKNTSAESVGFDAAIELLESPFHNDIPFSADPLNSRHELLESETVTVHNINAGTWKKRTVKATTLSSIKNRRSSYGSAHVVVVMKAANDSSKDALGFVR